MLINKTPWFLLTILGIYILPVTIQTAPEKLYWVQAAEDLIRRADTDGMNREDLFSFPQTNNLIDLVVDPFSGDIFWAQEFEDRIYKANNDGTSFIPIIEFPIVNGVKAIAVDPLEQKIYFAHSIDDQIIRMDFNGNNHQIVFDFPVVLDVVDIAIDPVGRKIYWVEAVDDRIRRKNLDGTGVIDELVSFPEASGVTDLALDIAGQKIYWSQTFNDRIRRADFGGTNIETFIENSVTAGVVDIQTNRAGNTLFWAQNDDTIQKISVSGGSVTLVLDWPDVNLPVAITMSQVSGSSTIPAVSTWGLIIFSLLIVISGTVIHIRRLQGIFFLHCNRVVSKYTNASNKED